MDIQKVIYLTKCTLRVIFIVFTNLYCIPTYLLWTWVFFLPFRIMNHPGYWYVEGILYEWLLSMVASWSWQSKCYIVEVGDDVSSCLGDRSLLLVNHQSTADVPMLMAAFQGKNSVLPSVMWIMDRLFRYTNFGLVSVTHGDYFITQGKNVRDYQMQRLRDHLLNVYLVRDRRWIILFPEGGFLSKRKETSVKYATENNFPILEHVTLPRVGAMHLILETLHPNSIYENIANANSLLLDPSKSAPLKWVIDVTVGYPCSKNPLDLLAICAAARPSCITYIHYRRYSVEEVPLDTMESLRDWLYARWAEKEELLSEYYSTGIFPQIPKSQRHISENDVSHSVSENKPQSHQVILNNWWIGFLHLFFLSSSLFHCYLLRRLWSYTF